MAQSIYISLGSSKIASCSSRSKRFYLTLNNSPNLTKPKFLFATKITPKFYLQNCPPSVANTMLGICYTCAVLCCSAHGCCSVECGVACCMAHSHCNPYTPPHQTVRTPVDTKKSTKHTNQYPNPWGPGVTPGHAQGITDRAYWGPS